MSKVNQKEATVSTIMGVLSERGVDYELGGDTPISEVLTDSDKATVRSALFAMFRDGSVIYKPEFEAKVNDDAELKKYISGLVNNWIRKAKDFNCGQAYKAKNPGSRAHAQDDQLKALKALSSQYAQGSDEYNEIVTAIATRKAEIEAEKAKSVTIDVDALPESLRHLANK